MDFSSPYGFDPKEIVKTPYPILKNWYFASRRRHEKDIKYLVNLLSEFGHKCSFDLTNLNSMKPYEYNEFTCEENAYMISKTIKNSNVFVMISDKGGTDMFMELGLAVGNYMEKNSPRVYVVGKDNNRSLMHFHPSINRVKNIESVFERECPEVLFSGKFISPKFL